MKYKVLIVDDSFSFRNLLKNAIKNSQNIYEVIGEAKNGQEAVDLYKKLNPDIVTMDLSMPVKDGVYATEEILRYNPQAKIIVVTGTTIEELIDSVKELGIKNIVKKPFQNNLLISIMNDMMVDDGGVIEEEEFDVVIPVFTHKPKEDGLKPILPINEQQTEPVLKTINPRTIEVEETVPLEPVIPVKEFKQEEKVVTPLKPVVDVDEQPIFKAEPVQKPIYTPKVEKDELETVIETTIDNLQNKNNDTLIIEEDDEDDIYTPPTSEIEDDEDDVYTPPTSKNDEDEDDVYTSPVIVSHDEHKNEEFKTNHESVVEEKIYVPLTSTENHYSPIENTEQKNETYVPETVIHQHEQTKVIDDGSYLEDDLVDEKPINKEPIKEIIEEEIPYKQIVQKPIIESVIEEEKIVKEIPKEELVVEQNIYQPMREEINNEKSSHEEEEVYRDVYKPMNEGATEDIIPIPNLGQNAFRPQYEDKNAFELKGTSEQLKKPVHWEDDDEEGVEELTMALPGSGNQTNVKPTPRQENVMDERNIMEPQQPIPQRPIHPNRGQAPKMPEPPKPPVTPNKFGVSRPTPPGPPRPEHLSAQPPRPPRNMNEPAPPMQQGGYSRENHPRNQYGQQGGNHQMSPPMPPINTGNGNQSNYYERPQNNQYGGQPPLEQQYEQQNYEVAPLEDSSKKKKGGFFGFISGLFSKKK